MGILDEICYELNNYFDVDRKLDTFVIQDGNIQVDFLQEGQYFRVLRSIFNDGIYQYPQTDMTDETFYGEIWPMAVPKDVLSVVDEIDQWQQQYGKVLVSPYTSESFGGYTYSKRGSGQGGGSGTLTWKDVFLDKLKRWYKLWA